MDPFRYFYDVSAAAAASFAGNVSIDLAKMVVEPPRNSAHGDVATNLPLILASQVKANPIDVGKKLIDRFRGDEHVAEADLAPPGFINLRLKPAAYHTVLK